MRKIILFLLAGTCLLQACEKEDIAKASGKDINWYSISENQTDELGKLRYKIYRESGVCIFYNDTIGSETRYNMGGEAYTHYEVLKPGYRIGGSSSSVSPITYKYTDDKDKLLAGATLLRDKVIARIDPVYLPACFMLVDDLVAAAFEKPAFKDLMAIYIGKASRISDMNEKEKEVFACDVIGVILASVIVERYPEAIALFYRKTNESVVQSKYPSLYNGSFSSMFDPWFPATPYALGFLIWQPGFYATTVSQTMDVEMFIALTYAYTEAEVVEQYGNYPVVMDKYYMMKNILADFDKSGR